MIRGLRLRSRLFLTVASVFLVFCFLLGIFSYVNASSALKKEAAIAVGETGEILYNALHAKISELERASGGGDDTLYPFQGNKIIYFIKNNYKNTYINYPFPVAGHVYVRKDASGGWVYEYRRALPEPFDQWSFVLEKKGLHYNDILRKVVRDYAVSSLLVLPFLFAIMTFVSARITEPLSVIAGQIENIARGGQADFSGHSFWGEIASLAANVTLLSAELRSKILGYRYFDGILKSVTDMIFILDPVYGSEASGYVITDGIIRNANASAIRLTGYAEDEITGLAFGSLFHEDADSVSFAEKKAGLFRAELSSPAGFTLKKKDGSPLKVMMNSSVMKDQLSGTTMLILSAQDFTHVKGMEDRLNLSQSVFDNAIEAVVITDRDAVIEYVNPAFTAITGYTYKEVIGQHTRILKSNHHDREFYKDMWETLEREGKWKGEIWNRRKNGEAYPQWMTVSAVRDENGAVHKYVSVFHDMTDIKRSEEQLRYQKNYDALTGLTNSNLFRDRVRQLTLHPQQDRFAVMILGLDRFMSVNESMGYVNGDILLRQVAGRLSGLHSKEESLCRWGGDEFAVILSAENGLSNLAESCSRTLSIFEQPFHLQGFDIFVTASAGVAVFPEDGRNADDLLRNAAAAMHRAKQEGGNSYQLYEKEMNRKAMERLILDANMKKAIMADEFVVFYQAKTEASTGRLTGMEALVRWNVKGSGIISPAEFIQAAEENGLVCEIDASVLRKAVFFTKELNDSLGLDLKVAVNISSKKLRQENLPAFIEDVLSESGLPASCLELEITESSLVSGSEEIISRMNWLRSLGIRLSLDDFGTGYSSLSYLKKFPIGCLKIDQSFVREMHKNEEDAGIVHAVIAIGRALGLATVAEGVETEEHCRLLREAGCTELQGYYISRPLPPDAFKEFCRNHRV